MKKFWLLLFGCFVLGALPTLAQKKHYTIIEEIKPIKTPRTLLVTKPIRLGYQSHIELGTTLFLDYEDNGDATSIDLRYIGGWRFNNNLFLGAGIGLMIPVGENRFDVTYISAGFDRDGRIYSCWCDDPSPTGRKLNVPLFLHARVYFVNPKAKPSQTRFVPYLSLSLGARFGGKAEVHLSKFIDWSSYADFSEEYGTSGFFVNPELGMNFRLTNRSNVTVSISYWGDKTANNTFYDAATDTFGVERKWQSNLSLRIGYSF